MKKEYHIRDGDKIYTLFWTQSSGLAIRGFSNRPQAVQVLYPRCADGIDVSMTDCGNVYVLAQTQNGTIIKIMRSEGAWHKADVLIPKINKFYTKRFRTIAYNSQVAGFFNIEDGDKQLLCMQLLTSDGASPLVMSYILRYDAFDTCATSPHECAVCAVDESGALGVIFYDLKHDRSSKFIPVFEGTGISDVNMLCGADQLHIVFRCNGFLFYISMDIQTKTTKSVFDVGSPDNLRDISLSATDNEFVIVMITEKAAEAAVFDLRTGETRSIVYNYLGGEIIEIHKITPCERRVVAATIKRGEYIPLSSL